MKIHPLIIGVLTAGCLVLRGYASAQVSVEDFNALKQVVEQLTNKVERLEELHEQDQVTHATDQKRNDDLQQQLNETRAAVTNVDQKADEVAKVQSAYPIANTGALARHNFTMVGDAEVQFGKAAGQHSAFVLADFAPIFLFRANDNILFEAGFDIMLQNNTDGNGNRAAGSSTAIDLSFAQMDYLFNDYVTVVAGDMVLPLGTYSERAAGWLNKIPDDPMVRSVLPGSGVGVQLRGAVPVGQSGPMVTYSVYAVNGPSSSSTNGTANASDLDLGGNVGDTPNWHANPSVGGRIGFFYPWKAHYDFELGLSGQTGEWSDSGNRMWSAFVLDGVVHISPYFEVKGEYINTWVETDDMGTIRPQGWWVQAGYKLAGLNLSIPRISNVELVGRYDTMNDGMGTKTDRYTLGYVYYISNTLLFEGDYEFLCGKGAHDGFVLQLSYGF